MIKNRSMKSIMLIKKVELANDEAQNKKSTITYSADTKIATSKNMLK